jgi:DNA (cytosine-5)-methyltransferase 1
VIYGSVCSGVAPQTQAWSELGWKCAWFAEIEPFPSAVLKYRFPYVPNHGDFTKLYATDSELVASGTRSLVNTHSRESSGNGEYAGSGSGRDLDADGGRIFVSPIDVLVGGTPCQSFSVAGKRAGLDDPRGNLTIEFARLAQRLRPRWLVWENVPGVLSIDDGRTFGAFLGILGELGYGVAYRVLDAQYFGVAQRRRRVFVVGHLGDWRRAAAVLFERESLSGNPAPSRETRQRLAGSIACGLGDDGELARALTAVHTATGRLDCNEQTFVATAFSAKDHGADASEEVSPTLRAGGFDKSHANSGNWMAVAFSAGQSSEAGSLGLREEQSPTLRGAVSGTNQVPAMMQGMAVRRLTPRECERLQGMQDDFTLIPWKGKNAPDGPRYKAIGNSWAVPVLTHIAKRINAVQEIIDGAN